MNKPIVKSEPAIAKCQDGIVKHTAGPWEFIRGGENNLRSARNWAVMSGREADVWLCYGPTWDEEFNDESFANARLIAAAPELLAALQALSGWGPQDDLVGAQLDEFYAAEAAARAAISKAIGG